MKLKLLITGLALLVSASPSFAGGIMMMGGGVAATGSSDPLYDFEETGTPGGWDVVTGSPNFDYTTVHLADSESLAIPTSSDRAGVSFTGSDTVYISFQIQYPTLPGLTSGCVEIYDSANSTLLGTFSVRTTGNMQAQAAGGSANNGTPALTAGNTMYVKIRMVKGTESNADASFTVWGSSDGTNWTQAATSTNGTTTAQPAYARFKTSSEVAVYDTVKISASDITDAR